MRNYIVLLVLLCFVNPILTYGQWFLSGNLLVPGNYLGSTNAQDLRFRTNNVQRMVLLGTGNVGFLGLGIAVPQSVFHINTSATGDLFRSNGPTNGDNRWQLFTSNTERFRVRTLAGGFDTYLERTQPGSEADIRLLTAQVEVRARNKRFFDEMLKC